MRPMATNGLGNLLRKGYDRVIMGGFVNGCKNFLNHINPINPIFLQTLASQALQSLQQDPLKQWRNPQKAIRLAFLLWGLGFRV